MVNADLKDLIDLRQCQDLIKRLRQENQIGLLGNADVRREQDVKAS